MKEVSYDGMILLEHFGSGETSQVTLRDLLNL